MKCCICDKDIVSETDKNNPWPVDLNPDAVCRNACNARVVVPARVAMISRDGKYVTKHINDLGEESCDGDT